MIAPLKDGKVCQSALRHRVRNLRAKVRLLLPVDVCCKHKKRTKNVLKMMQNRGFHPDEQQWYAPTASTREKHIFERLTKAQIEQIKQDKLYYVGEDFIDEFDRFIEGKKANGTNRNWKRNAANFSIPQLGVGMRYKGHHKSSTDLSDPSDDKENKNIKRRIRNMVRFENIQEKRKLITEQAMRRKAEIKDKMEERERRRQMNFERASIQREKNMQERSLVNQMRTSMSFRTKKYREETGQIALLSEKLRGLCLQNGSKIQR